MFASKRNDMAEGDHKREEAFIFLLFWTVLRVNFKLFPERRGREGLLFFLISFVV